MKEFIYVTGHKNPDTDSIVSAIAYAALKNALGFREYKAARIGEISDQSRLVLEKFGFEAPYRLHTVRTQVRDLSYDKPPMPGSEVTIHRAWELLSDKTNPDSTIALPITDDDGHLFGMLTSGDIAAYEMGFVEKTRIENIPLFNLISNLDGQIFSDSGATDRISGELIIALPGTETDLPENAVVLMGNQPECFRAAVQAHASAVILCGTAVDRELLQEAGDVLVVSTPYDAYRTARLIIQALPVSSICHQSDVVSFHLTDFIDDVRETTLKTRFRSYPILDENDRVCGTLSRYHLIRPSRKRVVLVDHNEISQSVPGLEQAEILEIIDHHRLADVQTGAPIYVRNEPVGSTCTIVTGMFQESGIMPSRKLAGLLAAGIVADTVMFKSPTATERDRIQAERMARHAGISLESLAKEIFTIAHDAMTPEEMLFSDFKHFQIAGHALGIGQVTCTDASELSDKKEVFLSIMEEKRAKEEYDLMLLMLTDVLREGTELLVAGDAEIVEQAFNTHIKEHSVFLPGIISRKKQIVPALSVLWG